MLSSKMDLIITAIGMTSPVGHDAKTTCASIRAGLTRFQPISHFQILEDETQEMISLIGSPVFAIAEGFSHIGRWLQMAWWAFQDLAKTLNIPTGKESDYWKRTGLSLVTPIVNDDRFLFAFFADSSMMYDVFVKPLAGMLAPDIQKKNIRLFMQGRTGVMEAIYFAARNPDKHDFDRMLVIAVDSCIDGMSLEWLAQQGRLKSGGNSTGIIPGEAAAAFMLELGTGARAEESKALAKICALAVDREKAPHLSDEPNHARALSKCLRNVLAFYEGKGPLEADFYIDLNGENWRAYEYGTALTRIPSTMFQVSNKKLIIAYLGEIGASSVAAAIVCSVNAFQRDKSAPDNSVIVGSSLGGRVGALMLRKSEKKHG